MNIRVDVVRMWLIMVLAIIIPVASAKSMPSIAPPPPKPFLKVNGRTDAVSIDFNASGGYETLSISTNQGTPSATSLPSWISVVSSSSTQMQIKCSENNSSSSRNGYFYVNAGKKSVRVNVYQSKPQNRLTINSVSFANKTYNGSILDEYGQKLYSDKMRYLTPKISYSGLSSSQTKTVYVKIIKPDGSLLTGSSSPNGYTYSHTITFYSGYNSCEVLGWGNNNGGVYSGGTYTIEFWIDGSKAYSANVYINPEEKLTISDVTFANTTKNGSILDEYGQTLYSDKMRYLKPKISYSGLNSSQRKTVYVKIIKPDGSLSTGNSSPNGYSFSREITFLSGHNSYEVLGWGSDNGGVYSCGGTYTIEFWIDGSRVYSSNFKIHQSSKVNKVWVDHNVYQNGQKGMKIHIDFETKGAKGHTIWPVAYFYYSDGTKLQDYDGNYNTADNQVSTSQKGTATYDHSLWSDFTLFLPYDQLHLSSGNYNLKFNITIYDHTDNNKILTTYDYVNFTFSK